jgi:tape measure domain-containing protein
MADNKRTVALDVAVSTSGAESLGDLSGDLKTLAKTGGDAAPAFQKLADELEEAQTAASTFRTAEAAARAEVTQKKVAVDAQRDALARMRAEATAATRGTVEFQEAERAAKVAILDASIALRDKRAALSAAASAAKEAAAAEKQVVAQANEAVSAYRKQASATKDTTAELAGAFSRLGLSIGAAFSAREIAATIARAESLKRSLEVTAGSAEAGAKTYDYLKHTANDLGLELFSTADAFKSFSAATRGTALEGQQTRDAFEALANASSKLALDTRDTEGAFRAVAQIASKGTISLEELRGQLGEALPGALQAAARGAGVTTERLIAMVETGQLAAKDFIPALTRGLNDLYKAGAPPDNVTAGWNRFKNTLSETAIALGEGGAGTGLTKAAGATAVAVAAVSETLSLAGTAIGAAAGSIRNGTVDFSQLRDRADEADKRLKNLAQTAGLETAPGLAKVASAAEDAATRIADAFRKAEHAPDALKLTLPDLELKFDTLRGKGDSAAEAIAKIGKDFDLITAPGIVQAEDVLTRLKNRGEITAGQFRDAWIAGLQGISLADFEARAEAAFRGTVGEARKLQSVLDVVADESLRRFGTSLQEVGTGISKATLSALSDVDVLVKSMDRLGLKSDDTARAISKSLGSALDTAGTERAVQSVIDKYTELGKQGLITGDQIAAGMEKARQKIDDLKPGVQGLDEALRQFGLKTQGELQATADKLSQSYQQIANSTTTSLADQRRAFDQFAAAATAANKGIEPSAVAAARAMLEIKEAAAGVGKSVVDNMRASGRAVDEFAAKAASASRSLEERNRAITEESNKADADRAALNHTAADNTGLDSLKQKVANGTLSANDLATAQAVYDASKANLTTYQQNSTSYSMEGAASAQGDFNAARNLLAQVKALANAGLSGSDTQAGTSTTHKVEITLGGRATTINTASANDASALADLLGQLGDAKTRAA